MRTLCFLVVTFFMSFALAFDASDLDPAAFAEHVAGKESPMAETPTAVVWTTKTKPDFRGVKFGPGREAGVRHLRIGFGKESAVGSVFVSGGGSLSVLKAGAAYAGAFILRDAAESWLNGGKPEPLREAAAKAYAKNQGISVKSALGVFAKLE